MNKYKILLRASCIDSTCIPARFGLNSVVPMQLADLLFEYVKNGKVNDPQNLEF